MDTNDAKIIAALEALSAACTAVGDLWDHTGTNMIDGYPLEKDWSDFSGDVAEWAFVQKKLRSK